MSAMTDALENALINHIFGNGASAYTAPSPWVGLFSVTPTDSSSGTEVSGGGYVRLRVTNWDAAASGATENSSAITFAQASASYNVCGVAILDASTAGSLLLFGPLSTSKLVGVNDNFEFAASALDVSLD